MANYSFDIESTLHKAELSNVYEQVRRDMLGRYDFKGTPANLEWLNEARTGFKITGSSDYQIEAIIELIRLALSKRGQSQKLLDVTQEINVFNMRSVKEVPFKFGLDSVAAKQISKLIRDKLPKLKVQIQGETVRVIGKSRDDLSSATKLIRAADLDYPIQFTNFH